MWMMGYNEGAEFNLQDSFNGRKLRPLIPRTAAAASSPTSLFPRTAPSSSSSSLNHRIHGTDLLAFNHHMAAMVEQSKRDFNTQQVIVSSRWNPTPEQLQMLEDLYRRGTRTPSTEEIQQITAQLRRFGKIEGKNVFYWFQNHKARERQKRRRQLESTAPELLEELVHVDPAERKDSGANRTVFEAAQSQTKNWPPPTNCSTLAEKSVSIQRAEKTADGWMQVDEEELQLQQRRTLAERNATWQMMMQLSCSSSAAATSSSSTPFHSNHHINYTNCTITPTTTTTTVTTLMDHHHQHPNNIIKSPPQDHLNIIFANPETDHHLNYHFFSVADEQEYEDEEDDDEGFEKASQTLQLFPLRSDSGGDDGDEERESDYKEIKNFTPGKFFEFLPLKN